MSDRVRPEKLITLQTNVVDDFPHVKGEAYARAHVHNCTCTILVTLEGLSRFGPPKFGV